jgi:hypothetical protein
MVFSGACMGSAYLKKRSFEMEKKVDELLEAAKKTASKLKYTDEEFWGLIIKKKDFAAMTVKEKRECILGFAKQ